MLTMVGTVLVVGALCSLVPLRASAATLGGTATITPASGASTTTFELDPAQGAVCTGSSNTGTFIYSYLVRPDQYSSSTLSPLSIAANGLPTNGLGLFNGSGYVGNANTDAPPSGQTNGAVDSSLVYANGDPQFSRVLPSAPLTSLLYSGASPGAAGSSGTWEAGLLCADATGAVTDFWNAQVTFAYSATDHNHFTWTSVAGLGTWGTTTTTTTTGTTTTSSSPTSTTPTTVTTTTPTTAPSTTTTTAPVSVTSSETTTTTPAGTSQSGSSGSGGSSNFIPGGGAVLGVGSGSRSSGGSSVSGGGTTGGSGSATASSGADTSTGAGSGSRSSSTEPGGGSSGSAGAKGLGSATLVSSGMPTHVSVAIVLLLLGAILLVLAARNNRGLPSIDPPVGSTP